MKVRLHRFHCYILLLGTCAWVAAGCGGGGGGGGDSIEAGDDVTFTAEWEGPADLDLSVITPTGVRVSLDNPSAAGCSLDGDAGGSGGTLSETITCPSTTGGSYEAYVENLEGYEVRADLEITSLGDVIDSESLRISPGSTEGPFRVDVSSNAPPVEGIEGTWREDRARLRSSNCSDQLEELLGGMLPFAAGILIVERSGNSVSVSDADQIVTARGSVEGTVIDVDTSISDSGGGCFVSVDLNLRADLGHDPTTATYNLDWSFSGCPGFFDCHQVIETRWRR